jgi:hypothetical protein
MADAFFDYVKVGKADDPDPFSIGDLFASMSKMEAKDASFVGCFYGEPGTRKTTRAMKLAQAITGSEKKILYIYTGQGWTSLMNHPELMARTIKMPFIRNEQIETLRTVLMNKDLREKLNVGAVIFDEYNRMQDMDTDILTKHRAGLVNKTPTYGKDGKVVYKDPDTPEWPEYNTTKVRLINLINDLLVVPDLHTIFVCHTRFQKSRGQIEPDFPNAAGSAFISMVHSLYLTKKEDGPNGTVFPIELIGREGSASKNRIGGLPAEVMDVDVIAAAYKKWGVVEGDIAPVVGLASKVETVPDIPVQPEVKAPISAEPDLLADLMG